jgi:hypothetical protein
MNLIPLHVASSYYHLIHIGCSGPFREIFREPKVGSKQAVVPVWISRARWHFYPSVEPYFYEKRDYLFYGKKQIHP